MNVLYVMCLTYMISDITYVSIGYPQNSGLISSGRDDHLIFDNAFLNKTYYIIS